MKQGNRKNWLLLLVIASLLVNAVMTTPALADDSLPPSSETTEESAPPQETSGEEASQEPSSSDMDAGTTTEESSQESTSTDEGTPAEEPASSEVPAEETYQELSSSEEPTSSETPAEETSVAEVLAEVPEGTEVVVLDEVGETVPLATEEAAEIVYTGDPIWCPAGVAVPTPGKNGCSPSFTKFGSYLDDETDSLLGWLKVNDPGKAGVVWIEKTYDSASIGDAPVVAFDGGVLTNMANFSLTLKGGWNGVGTGTVDVNDESVFNGSSLSIINWKGAVTLSDIHVTNASNGDCGAALCVETQGNIKLVRVEASGNDDTTNGADLDNTSSTASSSVTVMDSKFSQNDYAGLVINTAGAVTLKNVDTSENTMGPGAHIVNLHDAAASAVSITNSTFNGNGSGPDGYGLQVISNGNVTLANVTAIDNTDSGAYIDNSFGSGNVALNNTNTFLGNGGHGLDIFTFGNVTARHLVANANGMSGVFIDNADALAAKAVTLSGSGEFKGNGSTGLEIYSSGAVTLNNLTAVNNANGVVVQNYYLSTGPIAAPVRINGINNFNGNGAYGLYVDSDGAILLSRVTADSNGLGVDLNNSTPDNGPQNVTVLGYLNAFNNGTIGTVGLSVHSQGAITIANLNASHNVAAGAILDNSLASAPRNVTLTGTNIFSSNRLNGLRIYSRGAVTLSNVTAAGNGMVSGFEGNYSGVIVFNNIDPAVQRNVTLTGTNVFNHNGLNGLHVESYGAISLSNATAISNGKAVVNGVGYGVYLENRFGVLVKPVTVSGVNLFANNDGHGLGVHADGAITVSRITAVNNGTTGVFLANRPVLPKAQSKVTILGYGVFNSNSTIGLTISSYGAITTSNLTVNGNGNTGTVLHNHGLSAPQAVTLHGVNNFNHNGGSAGLLVTSDGQITVSNLTASYNSGSGAILDNYTHWDNPIGEKFATFGSITLTGFGNFVGNGDHGLELVTHGNVSLSRVSADANGSDGIRVLADGKVLLACSSAYDNGDYGLYVRNATDTGAATAVTLKGFFSYLNGVNDESLGGAPLVRTACP